MSRDTPIPPEPPHQQVKATSKSQELAVSDKRLTALLGERSILIDQLRDVERQLNSYRTQCPTCRCLLLPGERCRCCELRDRPDPECFV